MAGLWILLAKGGGSILQGLGCSPSVELSSGTSPPLATNVVNISNNVGSHAKSQPLLSTN